jgi:MFS family permease
VFLWLSRFTVFLGYAAFIQYVKLYVDSNLNWQDWLIGLGFSAEAIATSGSAATAAFGAIVTFFIIGGLVGSRVAGPLAERFGKKAVIGGGMIIAAIADIPLVMTSNVWLAVACGVVIGVGWGAFISADWAFACTLMPKQKAGSYMGIWDISTLLPQVISPVLAGLLYQAVYAYFAGRTGFAFTLSTAGIPAENPAAAALGFKWVITSLLVYFAIGLWILRFVKEERPKLAA